MPEGPLGGPRPFSEYRLIIDPQQGTVDLFKVGPLGGPRPFAKNNPPITDEEIQECLVSDTGRAFGAGVISGGQTSNLADLPAPQVRDALEITEEYCVGVLEGVALEDAEEGDAREELEAITSAIEQELPEGESVQLEVM